MHLGIWSRSIRAALVGACVSILIALGSLALPRAVGDVLWNNGIVPNGVHSRALSPPAFPHIRAVDEFVIAGPEGWTIRSFRASVVELDGWSSGTELTLYFRADNGGPGDLVREVVAGFDRVATGEEYFGMANYEYLAQGLEIDLCPGTYWLGLRNHDASGSGTNFWVTSDGGVEGADSEFGWFSRDRGDNWDAEGWGWHRAFVLTGTSSTACGACCLSGGACEQLSSRQCAAQHGLYRGDRASCEGAECPIETRACCLSGDACIDATVEDCERLGGAAGSEDSDCRDEDDNGRSDACESGCVREPAWQCDGDVDGDGQVNPVDSGLVQAAFGSVDEQDLCSYDVDCDGQINPVDSGIVQSLFGTCEEPRDVCP